MSAEAALQQVIVARLKNGLQSVANRVYDSVPAAAVMPYVSLGAYDFVPDDAECIFSGVHTQLLNVWSRKLGTVECKSITGDVRRLFRGYAPDMGAYGLVSIEVDFADVNIDPDGLTARGRVQIRAMMEEPE